MGIFIQSVVFAIAFVGAIFIYAKILQAIGTFNLKHKNVFYKKITATIGVPVHEIGHLIVCILFLATPQKVKLLKYNKDSVTGYVRYGYYEKSFIHRAGIFFIASGPLFSASVVALLVFYFISADPYTMFPGNFSLSGLIAYIQPDSWRFWVGMFVILSVTSHLPFSNEDISKIKESAGLACVFLFIVFLITFQTRFSESIFEFMLFLINMSVFYLVFLLGELVVLFILNRTARMFNSKKLSPAISKPKPKTPML